MGKTPLTRCGACGAWQSDPRLYTEEEQNTAELVHCGCESEEFEPTPRQMYEQGIISRSEYENL